MDGLAPVGTLIFAAVQSDTEILESCFSSSLRVFSLLAGHIWILVVFGEQLHRVLKLLLHLLHLVHRSGKRTLVQNTYVANGLCPYSGRAQRRDPKNGLLPENVSIIHFTNDYFAHEHLNHALSMHNGNLFDELGATPHFRELRAPRIDEPLTTIKNTRKYTAYDGRTTAIATMLVKGWRTRLVASTTHPDGSGDVDQYSRDEWLFLQNEIRTKAPHVAEH